MNTLERAWQWLAGRGEAVADVDPPLAQDAISLSLDLPADIAPDDPIMAHFQSAPGTVDLETLKLDSPGAEALRAAGVKLVVPLVSQGELIGLLNLGPRLSEQDYSRDDRRLLENLATQAAPAVRVAQLVRAQEAEARARERIEQELQVARLIQQNLLPKEAPNLPGWRIEGFYRPARAVGGDFYDFIDLGDGLLGIVIGDVTDKGVPAALVMAATRSLLRASAQRLQSPGEALARVNELLCPDTPPNMFVTCLFAVLDPASGHLSYANAGHDVPYIRRADGSAEELRARGMPLGLMPGMVYEEKETSLAPGEHVLFYSDGLAEAHNVRREMLGFPRVKELCAGHMGGEGFIECLLDELAAFTGPDWEQEDDVTLVTLRREGVPAPSPQPSPARGEGAQPESPLPSRGRPAEPSKAVRTGDGERVLAEFELPSEPGNERLVMQRVAEAVTPLGLPSQRLERLKTAVSEAAMNAIEHGNENRPEVPVAVRVVAGQGKLAVQITDKGGHRPLPDPSTPDLEAKLAGLDRPRGWGLFLIRNMVDEMRTHGDEHEHTLELVLNLEGADADRPI